MFIVTRYSYQISATFKLAGVWILGQILLHRGAQFMVEVHFE